MNIIPRSTYWKEISSGNQIVLSHWDRLLRKTLEAEGRFSTTDGVCGVGYVRVAISESECKYCTVTSVDVPAPHYRDHSWSKFP